MSLQRVQDALESIKTLDGNIGTTIWKSELERCQAFAEVALSDLKEYTETPKDKAKDRYHYGYTAAQNEYTERLESGERPEPMFNAVVIRLVQNQCDSEIVESHVTTQIHIECKDLEMLKPLQELAHKIIKGVDDE